MSSPLFSEVSTPSYGSTVSIREAHRERSSYTGTNDFLWSTLYPAGSKVVPIPDESHTRTAPKKNSFDFTVSQTDFVLVWQPRARGAPLLVGRRVIHPVTGRVCVGFGSFVENDDNMRNFYLQNRLVSASLFVKTEGIPAGAFSLNGRFNANTIHSSVAWDDFDVDSLSRFNMAEAIQGASLITGIVGLAYPQAKCDFRPIDRASFLPGAADLTLNYDWLTPEALPSWLLDPALGANQTLCQFDASTTGFIGGFRGWTEVDVVYSFLGTVGETVQKSITVQMFYLNDLGVLTAVPASARNQAISNHFLQAPAVAVIKTIRYNTKLYSDYPIAAIRVLRSATDVDVLTNSISVSITNKGYYSEGVEYPTTVIQLEGGAAGQTYGITSYSNFELTPKASFLTDVNYFDSHYDTVQDYHDALAAWKYDPNIKGVFTGRDYDALLPYFAQLCERRVLKGELAAFDMDKVWSFARKAVPYLKQAAKMTESVWAPMVDRYVPGSSSVISRMLAADMEEKLVIESDCPQPLYSSAAPIISAMDVDDDKKEAPKPALLYQALNACCVTFRNPTSILRKLKARYPDDKRILVHAEPGPNKLLLQKLLEDPRYTGPVIMATFSQYDPLAVYSMAYINEMSRSSGALFNYTLTEFKRADILRLLHVVNGGSVVDASIPVPPSFLDKFPELFIKAETRLHAADKLTRSQVHAIYAAADSIRHPTTDDMMLFFPTYRRSLDLPTHEFIRTLRILMNVVMDAWNMQILEHYPTALGVKILDETHISEDFELTTKYFKRSRINRDGSFHDLLRHAYDEALEDLRYQGVYAYGLDGFVNMNKEVPLSPFVFEPNYFTNADYTSSANVVRPDHPALFDVYSDPRYAAADANPMMDMAGLMAMMKQMQDMIKAQADTIATLQARPESLIKSKKASKATGNVYTLSGQQTGIPAPSFDAYVKHASAFVSDYRATTNKPRVARYAYFPGVLTEGSEVERTLTAGPVLALAVTRTPVMLDGVDYDRAASQNFGYTSLYVSDSDNKEGEQISIFVDMAIADNSPFLYYSMRMIKDLLKVLTIPQEANRMSGAGLNSLFFSVLVKDPSSGSKSMIRLHERMSGTSYTGALFALSSKHLMDGLYLSASFGKDSGGFVEAGGLDVKQTYFNEMPLIWFKESADPKVAYSVETYYKFLATAENVPKAPYITFSNIDSLSIVPMIYKALQTMKVAFDRSGDQDVESFEQKIADQSYTKIAAPSGGGSTGGGQSKYTYTSKGDPLKLGDDRINPNDVFPHFYKWLESLSITAARLKEIKVTLENNGGKDQLLYQVASTLLKGFNRGTFSYDANGKLQFDKDALGSDQMRAPLTQYAQNSELLDGAGIRFFSIGGSSETSAPVSKFAKFKNAPAQPTVSQFVPQAAVSAPLVTTTTSTAPTVTFTKSAQAPLFV